MSGLWLTYKLNTHYHVLAQTPYTASFVSKNSLQTEYQHWQNMVIQQPEYLDGYIMASYYASLLGDQKEACLYTEKGLHIDPNNVFLQRQCEENK